jgi:hypothetical protein
MQRGLLSDYFEGVAVKRLSAVEASARTSTNSRAAISASCWAMMIG